MRERRKQKREAEKGNFQEVKVFHKAGRFVKLLAGRGETFFYNSKQAKKLHWLSIPQTCNLHASDRKPIVSTCWQACSIQEAFFSKTRGFVKNCRKVFSRKVQAQKKG